MGTMEMSTNDLPQQMRTLIDEVVRHTRLWKCERKDVRAELEAHFRDGLEAMASEGTAPDRAAASLVEQFGDPRLAARLIRRGKKRARSPIWKLFVATSWTLILTVVAIALYIGWIFTGRAKPSVDYLAKINAPIDAVPESDRAWPILREVLLSLTPMPEEVSDAKEKLAYMSPSSEAWPAVAAWVQANRHLMKDIREAAQRPAYGCRLGEHEAQRYLFELRQRHPQPGAAPAPSEFIEPQVDSQGPQLISMRVPSLADCRQLARFLVLDARVHAAAGELPAAWESLDAARRLGFQLLGRDILIECLVGAANVNLALESCRSILYDIREHLPPTELAALRAGNWASSSLKSFQMDLTGERYMFEDLVQYVFTDNGKGDGHIIPSVLFRFMSLVSEGNPRREPPLTVGSVVMHAGRKATLAKYHEISAEMERLRSLPLYDPARRQSDALIEQLSRDPIDKYRYTMITMLLPSLNRADQRIRETVMNQSATQTLVALLAYRADHGRLPDKLTALVPEYLASVPIDIYSGHELRYSSDADGQFMLYSVGDNLVDDHGISTVSNTPGESSVTRLDLVYWPAAAPPPATAPAG